MPSPFWRACCSTLGCGHRLGCEHKPGALVAIALEALECSLQLGWFEAGAAAEDPAVLAAWIANHQPAVVGVDADDPVVAPERTPPQQAHEAHLQARIGAAIRDVTKLRGDVECVTPGSLPNDGLVIQDARSYK